MPETTEAYDFHGRTVVDPQGEKIGKIDELYHDDQGGQPEWALVNTGLFGTKKTFVPLGGASPTGEDLQVPVSKAQVKDAPRTDADQELSENEEQRLFEEEHEVVLHEEEPVIEKRAVPKERVRMSTETHEDQREVSEEIRKEQIELNERGGADG
ncbi:MAG TPA: DUF2382 domain-containing protein [Solirubrobacteraceae bacterium]